MKNVKRLLTIILVSVFIMSLSAQTDAGKIMIGGSSSLSSLFSTYKWKTDDDKGTLGTEISLNLTPQFGYFIINGLAVGIQLQTSFTQNKDDDTKDKSSTLTLAGAPFVRYYVGSGKLKPYVHAAVGVGITKDKDIPSDGDTTEDNYKIFNYQGKVGVGIFFNDHVSLDLGIGYSSGSTKPKENNEINWKLTTTSIGAEVGIVVLL
jgi:outer membrane protein